MDAQKCQRKLGKQEHFRMLVGMAVEEIDLEPFPVNNMNYEQCPTGTRTRPATRYFFRYPTQPDSVLKIIG